MSDIQFIVSAFNCGSRGVELGKCINLMTGSRSWQCHNEFIVIRPHQFISCLLDILWKTLNYSDSLTMICQRLRFPFLYNLHTGNPSHVQLLRTFIHFRAVHLRDLILLHTALPDQVEGNLVNFRKMVQLSQTLKELTKLQMHDAIPFSFNQDLVNTLRVGPAQRLFTSNVSCIR